MSIFKFQQFAVDQEGTTMKINTDGVLLAAFCQTQNTISQVLDIGTGTGVIALMLAQRYTAAKVLGIDIDLQTIVLAQENFKNALFYQRLNAQFINVLGLNCPDSFDLMISNPPYFTNSLKNPEQRKQNARHTDLHFFEQLFQKTYELGRLQSEFWMIIPAELSIQIEQIAFSFAWKVAQQVQIYNHEQGKWIRTVFQFVKIHSLLFKVERNFYIRDVNNQYTESYHDLLKEYFLPIKKGT